MTYKIDLEHLNDVQVHIQEKINYLWSWRTSPFSSGELLSSYTQADMSDKKKRESINQIFQNELKRIIEDIDEYITDVFDQTLAHYIDDYVEVALRQIEVIKVSCKHGCNDSYLEHLDDLPTLRESWNDERMAFGTLCEQASQHTVLFGLLLGWSDDRLNESHTRGKPMAEYPCYHPMIKHPWFHLLVDIDSSIQHDLMGRGKNCGVGEEGLIRELNKISQKTADIKTSDDWNDCLDVLDGVLEYHEVRCDADYHNFSKNFSP